MKLRKSIWLATLVAPILAILLAIRIGGRPVLIHQLPDGSTVKLSWVSSGKNLEAFWGKPWQRTLFRLCRTNFPSLRPLLMGGVPEKASSSSASGSLGLSFAHERFDISHGDITNHVSFVTPAGIEVFAVRRSEHLIYVPDGGLMNSLTFWELPKTEERTLRVRFYPSRSGTNFVEFPIQNPL